MPSWNNVVTTDGYQEFRFRRTRQVSLAVSNAPILAKFAPVFDSQLRDSATALESMERDMQNGSLWNWTVDDFPGSFGIVAVAIKSEIAGTPAVVTIHA